MGDGFAVAIVAILLAAFGMVVGFHAGEEAGLRCADARGYVVANLLFVCVGAALFFLVQLSGYLVLCAVALGIAVGGVAGLKFGFGDSVGPWKLADRLMSERSRERDRNIAAARRAERARRGARTSEPELMSVENTGDAGRPASPDPKKG